MKKFSFKNPKMMPQVKLFLSTTTSRHVKPAKNPQYNEHTSDPISRKFQKRHRRSKSKSKYGRPWLNLSLLCTIFTIFQLSTSKFQVTAKATLTNSSKTKNDNFAPSIMAKKCSSTSKFFTIILDENFRKEQEDDKEKKNGSNLSFKTLDRHTKISYYSEFDFNSLKRIETLVVTLDQVFNFELNVTSTSDGPILFPETESSSETTDIKSFFALHFNLTPSPTKTTIDDVFQLSSCRSSNQRQKILIDDVSSLFHDVKFRLDIMSGDDFMSENQSTSDDDDDNIDANTVFRYACHDRDSDSFELCNDKVISFDVQNDDPNFSEHDATAREILNPEVGPTELPDTDSTILPTITTFDQGESRRIEIKINQAENSLSSESLDRNSTIARSTQRMNSKELIQIINRLYQESYNNSDFSAENYLDEYFEKELEDSNLDDQTEFEYWNNPSTFYTVHLAVPEGQKVKYLYIQREEELTLEDLTGLPGLIGAKGAKGVRGNPGYIGWPGMKGPRGDDGEQGKVGPRGIQGMKGFKGYTGVSGPPGMNGEQGPIGFKGPRGRPGIIGFYGPPGGLGRKGVKGDEGRPGPEGLLGLPGFSGSDGDPGPDGKQGSIGLAGDPGKSGLPGADGKIGSKGSKGRPGLVGKIGDAGLPGSRGINGLPGEAGFKGPVGKQGILGDKGDVGRRGPQGVKGTKGLDGSIGEVGEIGEEGKDGIIGVPGEKGADGALGPAGEVGVVGHQGALGAAGIPGPKGEVGPRVWVLGSFLFIIVDRVFVKV